MLYQVSMWLSIPLYCMFWDVLGVLNIWSVVFAQITGKHSRISITNRLVINRSNGWHPLLIYMLEWRFMAGKIIGEWCISSEANGRFYPCCLNGPIFVIHCQTGLTSIFLAPESIGYIPIVRNIIFWLVVEPYPSEKSWSSDQLGWWHDPNLMGKS